MLWLLSSAGIGLLSIAVLAGDATLYVVWPGVSPRLFLRDRVLLSSRLRRPASVG